MNANGVNNSSLEVPKLDVPASEQPADVTASILADPPLAVSIKRFCHLTSVKKTLANKMIREGTVEVRRIGRRTVVLMSSVYELLGMDSTR